MAETTVQIDGMHCGSCVRRVGAALAAVEGVQVTEVRVGAARFESDPALVSTAVEAIAKIGFTPHLDK